MSNHYINVPLTYKEEGNRLSLNRELTSRIQILDNLVEIIVFTPRGSFVSDPDFGFDYWNYEYSNVQFRDFNNGTLGLQTVGLYSDLTKKKCQDSIIESLAIYQPDLKKVEVLVEIGPVSGREHVQSAEDRKSKLLSKYYVKVTVRGVLISDLGTDIPYLKEVAFLMEPTVKHYSI